ncbi:hypothetical protein ADU59_05080 [Pararhizobium polonicum]|uniref:Uncharacterized protein n=1 Tax=Pararhizobium polonicum TaxID=1612624 RepID=A0A1C7P767_9HYPH|nr:hypothetical protein [Pararhizobium polonicum]OBZ97060.1 hypothetical protein ADU59_05080 [Pararhizobium polonicum]
MFSEEYTKFLTTFMPVIAATLVTIFGMIAFYYQKSLERKFKYNESIQSRYENYIHSIFDVTANPSSADANAKFQQSRASLRLFAPTNVLNAAKVFEDHITGVERSNDAQEMAAILLHAMRQDCLPGFQFSERVDVTEMKRLNSFNVN